MTENNKLLRTMSEYSGSKRPVCTTRKGRYAATIVPLDDLEAMQVLEDAMDVKAARESLRDAGENGGTMDAEAFFESLDKEASDG